MRWHQVPIYILVEGLYVCRLLGTIDLHNKDTRIRNVSSRYQKRTWVD